MVKVKVLAAAGVVVLIGVGAAAALLLQADRDSAPAATGKHFRDVAGESGITWQTHFLSKEQGEPFKVNLYDHGSGVAVGDYDGDGHDDIYFVNQLGRNALYHNKGDGTFEDVTDRAGVGLGDRICTAATWADYLNEGRPSLFVTSTRGGNVLFRNRGDGTFEDVTKKAGLEHVGHSQAGFFFDYDGDGFLDLLVLQTGDWTAQEYDRAEKYYPGKGSIPELIGSPIEHNILYHNNGDGTFTDVTAGSGLEGRGWAADAAIFDYDGDGHPDVLITSMLGRAQLYRNNGDGTFTDVTRQTLGRTPAGGMGAKAFDFDNDGKLDVYLVDMHSDMWPPSDFDLSRVEEEKKHRHMFVPDFLEHDARAMEFGHVLEERMGLHYDEVVFGNTFHHNLGNGKFEEISDRAGLETFWPWGVAVGDFDNDGYEDVFLPSGMGYPWEYWPNRLLMNQGDGTFRKRGYEEGTEPPARGVYLDEQIRGKRMTRSSRAAAVADFDGDGRLEIVVNNFNDRPYLFKNDFPRRNSIAFRLTGTRSNRDAIGALVRAYAGGQVLTRQVNPAGGYLAQSSRTVHFGLGDRPLDRVEIRWPSGTVQVLERPAVNRLHEVTEPAK